MTYSFLKSHQKPSTQRGAVTIVITMILLFTATMIVLFAASYSLMQQKISANQFRKQQAFEAAEAGLEFGINYFQQNNTTITASTSGGYIQPYSDSNTSNVTLPNNSQYSIAYSNPIANNYNLILITSTGKSDDGTAIIVINEQIEFGSLLFAPGHTSLVTKGSVTLSGNGSITNTTNNSTIESGSTLGITGNGNTVTSGGTSSYAGHIGTDVQQNVAALASLSNSDLFAQYFGISSAQFQAKAGQVYNNSNTTSMNSALNGMTGTTIWINQSSGNATLSGNTTVGSLESPVILVINGNLDISGNVTIYGFIFVIGSTSATTDISGNVTLNGGLVATDDLNMSGNSSVIYNPAVFNKIQTSSTMYYYAKVPATWKDF